MEKEIRIVKVQKEEGDPTSLSFGLSNAENASAFHRSFSEYRETELCELNALAEKAGIASITVKDESSRFGLNAFKVLGGSYSIGRYLETTFKVPAGVLLTEMEQNGELRKKVGELTFVTATDGNHGRGVAWTASRLGAKSVVYLPEGSSKERLENIRKEGAEASILDMNYDDAVRKANSDAHKYGWVMIQDTAWEGYEEIPRWIMEGYSTMGLEITNQQKKRGLQPPSHIFLQAGVGAMAGAMTGFFRDAYRDVKERPVIVIVEPDQADCIFRTAQAGDGTLHTVSGRMDTIMAGLACGEPCPTGWEVLKREADFCVSMTDHVAELGMRILAKPLGEDPVIISGESGAAGFGCAAALLFDSQYEEERNILGLDKNSRVLCISTEGATDRENYNRIVFGQ